MPTRFDLPVLSEKDYAALQAELTAAIPRYSSNWTDYNYSDPGIALLQLLSWLGDISLYRIDTVPRELYLNFVRLVVGATAEALDDLVAALEDDVVRGADGSPLYLGDAEVYLDPARLALAQYLQAVEAGQPADVVELRTRTMAYWQASYLAVTPEDFARLAAEVTSGVSSDSPEYIIGRVVVRVDEPYIRVSPITIYQPSYSTDVETPTEAGREQGTLTATLDTGGLIYPAMCYDDIVTAIVAYLEPRRLLGTPVSVTPPTFNPLSITAQLACRADATVTQVLQAAYQALLAFLSPISGGPKGRGWPYGRPVTNYDVLAVLLGVDGVDHSQPVHVNVETLKGVEVGNTLLGVTTVLGPPDEIGLPQLWVLNLEALTDTWTLQVGVHARVGVDTQLPGPGL
jgi:hypothetical protein